MMENQIAEGSIVRFRESLEEGDADLLFVVLEDRDTRVLVADIDPAHSTAFGAPQYTYQKSELEVVTTNIAI